MERLFSIGLHNAAIMAVLAILVWSATRIWKSAPAAHLLWLLVLLKLITPPIVLVDLSAWTQAPARPLVPALAETPDLREAPRNVSLFHEGEPREPASERGITGDAEPGLPREMAQLPPALDVVAVQPAEASAPWLAAPAWGTIRWAIAWIWLVVASLIAVLAGVRIVRFRRILASLPAAEERLQSVARDLAARMGMRTSATVLQVDSAMAPFVWCAGRRAVIVLPKGLIDTLDERQLEMVLAHELAHLRRRDHWVRIAELVVSLLHWWNPLVWWVRQQLHAAEEECCDAWVAWLFPDESRCYAETLLKSAEAVGSPPLVLSSPFLRRHTLKERIEMVLNNCSQRSATRLTTMCLGLFALLTLPMGISVVRGQAHEETKAHETLDQVRSPEADSKPSTAADPQTSDKTGASEKPASDMTDASKKPGGSELDRFQGHWAVDSCESQYAGLNVSRWQAQRWRWTIKGNEITWAREGQEWKLKFQLDPDATPKQMDLTFVDGPHKGQTCPGIYAWDGETQKTLKILMQDPEADAGRPASFERKAESRTTQITLRPLAPIDPARELASFQGAWCWDFSQLWTWPQPIGVGTDSDGRKSEKRWVIDGNQITWVGRDGQRVYVQFTLDPFKAPKQIEFTFLNGPRRGQKSIGIYESRSDEDHRMLCMTDPGVDAPRPTDYSAGTFLKQSIISIYRVPAPPKPSAAKELERLQGVWQMTLCDSFDDTFGGTQQEASKWQWTIRDDEILWSRQGDVWKMKLHIDPSKKPRERDLAYVIGPFEIDLTLLTGPFKGTTCRGIYGFGGVDGQSLMIAIQDPGSDAPRPTKFRMTGGINTGLMILRPSKPSDSERELAAFQGTWTLRNFDTGSFERNKDPSSWPMPGGKGPDKSGAGSELRWIVKQHEISWTSPSGEEIRASFAIDPFKVPKQIDLTFLSGPHKGEVCPGIYQRDDLDENILWICVADPASKKVRPKEFDYQWGEGRSLLSLYPQAGGRGRGVP